MTAGRPKGTIKTGGRRKGTPNRLTVSLRQKIGEFVEGKLDEMEKIWKEELETKEKLQLFKELLRYVLPPPKETEEKAADEETDPLRDLIESLKE